MGLEEYIKAGATLKREVIELITSPSGSGSVMLGSAYVLLSINSDAPCRVRLYDNESSRDDPTELTRPFGNNNISGSIALVGDLSMSSAGNYTIDPIMYGVVEDSAAKLTYYRIDNIAPSSTVRLRFNRYLLEDASVSTSNRFTMPTLYGYLGPQKFISGSINSVQVPRTYLLVSGTVSGSDIIARVRLYSTSESLFDATEVSRSFTTESSATSKLIVDAIMSGSQTTYFVPKIVGANLKYMTSNLNEIKNDSSLIMGENEMYYIIENVATSGGSIPISASLHVFSMED